MSRIITFYSYKGGVGRTFALANVAALLAKRGKRVLIMDWDLEAPGLHRYFEPYLPSEGLSPHGLIHLLGEASESPNLSWRTAISQFQLGEEHYPVSLITSGDQAPDYIERVRAFSWTDFFENNGGGVMLDRWRMEWKEEFDFILIDSRTGITDTGGVCTVFLPDILVFVFSANEQSFEKGVQVVNGVQIARRGLSVRRPPLAVLPLPGRFDGRDELDESTRWMNRFSEDLRPYYDDWLPKQFHPKQIIELTKVPYITRFSFGEPLAVITHGVSDPEFPGFYLENISRLLVSDFKDAHRILSPDAEERKDVIAEFRSLLAQVPINEAAIKEVLITVEEEVGTSQQLSELLKEAGIALLRQNRFNLAESYLRRTLLISEKMAGRYHPDTASIYIYLSELLESTGRLSEAISHAEQALDILSQTDVQNDPVSVSLYTSLAGLYRQIGHHEEAIRLFHTALVKLQKTSMPNDHTILGVCNNLASVYREIGRYAEALSLQEIALDGLMQTAKPGDPALISAYNNLANVYREMDRREEALHCYEMALQSLMQTAKPGDPALISAYNNLANVYREMDRREEALHLFNSAIDASFQVGKSRSRDLTLLNSLNGAASCYLAMGRIGEASPFYQQALKLAYESFGSDSIEFAIAANGMGEIYLLNSELESAEDLLRFAEATLGERLGYNHPEVIKARANLAELLKTMGREDEASKILRESSFDVFIAHSNKDKRQVRELAHALSARGLRVWLDEWELIPGMPWQQALDKAVDDAMSAVVCIGSSGAGPWEQEEMNTVLRRMVLKHLPVIPVLLPGAQDTDLPIFLRQFSIVDLREGLNSEGIDRLIWGVTGKKPRARGAKA